MKILEKSQEISIKSIACSTKELAELLGVSDKQIERLTTKGFLMKENRGKYALFPSVQGFVRYVRENELEENFQKIFQERMAYDIAEAAKNPWRPE